MSKFYSLNFADSLCLQKLPEVFYQKGALKNFATKLTETLKETLAQGFFCEFYEVCKNTLFTEHSGRLLLCLNFKSSKPNNKLTTEG